MTLLESKEWRLNNLYRIIDKNSCSIPFRMNGVQKQTFEGLHSRNLILKARQLGLSTFAILYLLDDCIFESDNLSAGIVSYSIEHAQHIFKKIIGHAIDNLHPDLKPQILSRSAREICFGNMSSIRVDTSLRGGSYPLTLVSEFGKTCARNPLKAEEIITGTLQAVPINGKVIIESTGEGNEGFFAEMVNQAFREKNDTLSPLQYKLFFYAWFEEPTYRVTDKVSYDNDLVVYFDKLEKELSVKIDKEQRNWYALQCKILGDKIKQEYPSTVQEAFLASSDAFYFAEAIEQAYKENRCLSNALYDALLPVYVAMDIGVNDLTVIVFFQLCHGEIRVIDYYEDKNKGVDFYAPFLLQEKPYFFNTIFLPHDSVKRDPLDTSNSYERDFKRLFQGVKTKFVVLPKEDKQMSISHAKIKMGRCVFNISKTKKYVDMLAKYRKRWNEGTGRYLEEPLHNIASNYADCHRYMIQAVAFLETVTGQGAALEKHRQIVANRHKII
jgi:hypothetical protein